MKALTWGRRSRLTPTSRFLTEEGLKRSAPLIAELRDVAAAHDATPGQVALAWLVTYYGDTVVAIPGASRPEHATEAAGAMDLQLTEAEMQRIDRLSAAAGAKWGCDGADRFDESGRSISLDRSAGIAFGHALR